VQVEVDEAEQGEQRTDPDHRLEGEPHHVDRRLVGERDDVQAFDDGVRIVEGEQRQQPGNLDAVDDRVAVVPAEQVLGGAPGGLCQAFHRGELDRLVGRDVTGRPVADDHLQRRGDARGRHRDAERRPLVTAAAASQECPGVGTAYQEAGHDVGGEVHVRVLAVEHRVGEQRPPRVHVGRPAVDQGEPGRVVHPGVDGDDEERAGDAGERDREAGQEMRSRREPVPAVGVNADEDGFEEEGEALEGEAQSEHVPEVLHPYRPQQPEFEGQDRAGDHAHGEQREHDPRPAPGERAVELVAGSQVPVFGDEYKNGERDAEAHQRDVHGERERLHLPRFEQVVLVHAHRDLPYAGLLRAVVTGLSDAWVYLRIWMTFSMPRVVCSRPSWVSMKHAITQYPGFWATTDSNDWPCESAPTQPYSPVARPRRCRYRPSPFRPPPRPRDGP